MKLLWIWLTNDERNTVFHNFCDMHICMLQFVFDGIALNLQAKYLLEKRKLVQFDYRFYKARTSYIA